ncbi:hypothetical protein EI94DRAFT_1734055, partial [Lactarius quietus]
MTALPLDNLVMLTVRHYTFLDAEFWLRHAPKCRLLQRVKLDLTDGGKGFLEMLLQDEGGCEHPLLPSLTELVLIDFNLGERWSLQDSLVKNALRLCDALMKRVEQGVPLERLDLSMCHATSLVVQLLSEIVVDVCEPLDSGPLDSDYSSEGGLFR